jgi:hypothetical protein
MNHEYTTRAGPCRDKLFSQWEHQIYLNNLICYLVLRGVSKNEYKYIIYEPIVQTMGDP